MFKLLVDTCVWLDLAKDHRQAPLLDAMEDLTRSGQLALIVPQIVLDEFRRNRGRVAKEAVKSLSSQVRMVKEAVRRAGGSKRRARLVLEHLDDVNQRLPLIGGAAEGVLNRIDALLAVSPLDASDGARLRASRRALEGKAPFHSGKNAMADAVLIEMYAECVGKKEHARNRFAFVTHNKADFSMVGGNQNLPHADLAHLFSRIKSLYFINLAEALRRVDPILVTERMVEQAWTQEPRGLTELLEAEQLLFHQVWYNRHWNLRSRVERGSIAIVDHDESEGRRKGRQETIKREVWELALRSAARVEKRVGKHDLGPWSDFEWGMINGKLSALRWVLGDEWDMLDT